MTIACLQICRELLLLATFLRVHSNSREVSYLSWQNTHPNLKTTFHIKLNFFLWTKLLENSLLAKYFVSVATALKNNVWIPKLVDIEKVTLKSNLEKYKLSKTQKDRDNKIYPRLSYDLRNIYSSKTSFSSDILSLGYMFKHLYPSSPVLQMLRSRMLCHDSKKWVTVLCFLYSPELYGRCSEKWL